MQLPAAVRIFLFLCAIDSSVFGQSAWLEELQASVYGEIFTPANTALFTTLYQVTYRRKLGLRSVADAH